ncbi:MAG TPA: deoxyribose-phosphate aldolase [Verrucomicrobia bacterium]|nr:deoxyribose-phosphate aldolase [Verrucomicrobiota bacterium]
MIFTQAQVASVIDHAVLKTEYSDADIRQAAAMCKRRGIGTLCVRPTDALLAARELAGSDCRVCVVVGFPLGANRGEVKALEAEWAIRDGAVELDMVMNVGRFKSGERALVQQDIAGVVAVAHRHGVIVKVILETGLLTACEIADACRLAQAAGADYVKTATGLSGGGATPEAVAIMLDTVGSSMKVKASGGIRNWADAVAFLRQGCSRLGIGSSEAVLDGGQAVGDY